MNVKIRAVRDAGDPDLERLVLNVFRPDDIGDYAVFDTTYTDDGRVSNKLRHSFWFPDKRIAAGDTVVLYTKRGRANEKKNSSGATSHFFYWGLDVTVWNEGGDCAVLLHVPEWTSYRVVEEPKT